MAKQPSPPQLVYRLATLEEWSSARETGVVPLRDIDEHDGYVHLSTRDQALETARLHFSDAHAILALEIPLSAIADDVKFELAAKRGEWFAHLYGRLRADRVARAIRLERTAEGFAFGAPV